MMSPLLMLATFLCVGTQVRSLSFDYSYDYIVEGGRPLTVTRVRPVTVNETEVDNRSIGYRFRLMCYNCTSETVKHTVSGDKGDSFTLQAPDNNVKDELFYVVVLAFDKKEPTVALDTIRFTYVDNDDNPLRLIEGAGHSVAHIIHHPPNLPYTTYAFSDILDQSFNKQWEREPAKLTFGDNQGGSKRLKVVLIDDKIVEETTKYVLVIKRLISCEPVQRYYKHFVVSVTDNDAEGTWLLPGAWTTCEKIPFDKTNPFTFKASCKRTRKRTCVFTREEDIGQGKSPTCEGDETISEECVCPPPNANWR